MIPTQTLKPDIRRSRPNAVSRLRSLDGTDVLTPPLAAGGKRNGRCLPKTMSRGLATLSLAAAGLGLAACSTHGPARVSPLSTPPTSHPTTSATSAHAAATHPAPPASAGTQPPSSAASSTPSTTVAGCRTSALQLTHSRVEGTAGSSYITYYLQNRGPAPCTLTGFPGFALLDAHGAIIQRPAQRTDAHYSTATLHPDGRVQFLVRTLDPGVPETGCSAAWRTAQVQVYPPNETAPLRQPSTLQACDLAVGPVQSAPGGGTSDLPAPTSTAIQASALGDDRNADLVGIRTEAHRTYDRVVFDFRGPQSGLRYVVSYRGDTLGVCLEHGTIRNRAGALTYHGPAILHPQLTQLRTVRITQTSIDGASVQLTLRHKAGFRVFGASPDRIVVDIAH